MTIPVTLVNVGTNPNDNTGDPAQVAFTKINTSLTSLSVNAGIGGTVAATSPDGTLTISGSPGNSLTLSAGPLNVLPLTFSYAGLPSAAANINKFAVTTDKGAVFSNGTFWQILYNVTSGSLAIATNTPLPQAGNAVAYSATFVATGGIGPFTWTRVDAFSYTNVWSISGAGVFSGTPTVNTTDTVIVQVSDSTGAVAQKIVTIQTVSALSPAATPTFSPAPGTYATSQTVTISDSTPSSTIYYTTNGSTPTTGSTVYSGPITVSTTQTVKAIATAAGFSQSAVGSGAYTIGTVQNPIFVNFAAGGASSLEYEAFPTFVDLVRSSRGFCIGTGYVRATLNAAGFPNGTQATITIVLYTGSTTLLARQAWFYNFGASTYRTFKCSITSGTGLETPTGSGCVIANITRPGGGVVNFDLTFDGTNSAIILTVGTVSTAWTTCHCYLPDFPTGGGGGPASSLTTDCVTHYSQFGGIRFMFWSDAWNNTTHCTAANRNTPSNTVANKGWNDPGVSVPSEGYPLEWAVDLCIAANCGIWFCLPPDCANDYITAVANYLFANMPVGKPIFIEYSNEVWNGTGFAKAKISSLANAAGATYQNAQFTGTIVGSTLTVSGVTGSIAGGQFLYYSGSPAALAIQSGSGPYTLSASPGNIGPVAMTTSDTANLYKFLAPQLHNIQAIFSGIFTSRYGTDLRLVLGTQQGQGAFLAQQTIAQSLALGNSPGVDYHHIAVAPYMNLYSSTTDTANNNPPGAWNSGTAYVAGNCVSSGGNVYLCLTGNTNQVPPNANWLVKTSWSVAQIEAQLANTDGSGNPLSAPLVCYTGGNGAHIETLNVQSLYNGGKGVITYEGGWQTNTENGSLANAGAAIIDSGMQAIEQTMIQNVFNGGGQFHCRFESGVRGTTNNANLGAVDEFDISCANLIAGTSPRLKALAAFFNGATVTKNVLSGTGSSWSALNWTDNLTSTYPNLGNFFGIAPPYNVQGLVPYSFTCTTAGTYSLRVRLSNSGGAAANFDVSLDGTVVITGTNVIPNGASNSLITLGNVTVSKGTHALLLGRGFQSSVTIGSAANSGADITWV